MNQDFSQTEEVLIEARGPLGIITLNRPKALNALNLEMIRIIAGILRQWERDARIEKILFIGAGERAFCAGGDIKSFHRMGMDFRRGDISHKVSSVFFAEEYSLDRQIFHYPKPTIAFMNGIVMGGGYGIGGNCAHRIVSDKTLYSMPETSIGFFPDVGAAFHLLRTPQNLGAYLALTAAHVNGADMMTAKLADYFVQSSRQAELIEAFSGTKNVKEVLANFNDPKHGSGLFDKNGDVIARCFVYSDLPDILKALADDPAPFATETLNLIESRSPTSVMVTAEHLRRAEPKSFDEVIETDFILAQRFLQCRDFYEGIRAAVIDKDRKPRWDPAGFEGISQKDVEAYFEPTGHNLQDVRVFAR